MIPVRSQWGCYNLPFNVCLRVPADWLVSFFVSMRRSNGGCYNVPRYISRWDSSPNIMVDSRNGNCSEVWQGGLLETWEISGLRKALSVWLDSCIPLGYPRMFTLVHSSNQSKYSIHIPIYKWTSFLSKKMDVKNIDKLRKLDRQKVYHSMLKLLVLVLLLQDQFKGVLKKSTLRKNHWKILNINQWVDWLTGKSTGNHRLSHEIWDFPVIFPLNQSIESSLLLFKSQPSVGCWLKNTLIFLKHLDKLQ